MQKIVKFLLRLFEFEETVNGGEAEEVIEENAKGAVNKLVKLVEPEEAMEGEGAVIKVFLRLRHLQFWVRR